MKGRKRHLLVDVEGLPLAIRVHAADIQDRDGAKLLLKPLVGKFKRLSKLWMDSGYAGKCAQWITETLGWDAEVVRRPGEGARGVWVKEGWPTPEPPRGFVVVKRRWVVERSFAWLGRYRRMSKDYEGLTRTSEALIAFCFSLLLLHRLAKEGGG